MSISEKYNTKAAEYYRNFIQALVDGTAPPERPSIAEGKMPACKGTSLPCGEWVMLVRPSSGSVD